MTYRYYGMDEVNELKKQLCKSTSREIDNRNEFVLQCLQDEEFRHEDFDQRVDSSFIDDNIERTYLCWKSGREKVSSKLNSSVSIVLHVEDVLAACPELGVDQALAVLNVTKSSILFGDSMYSVFQHHAYKLFHEDRE